MGRRLRAVVRVMTVHKLSAGDGYTYLTRQVASADERRDAWPIAGRVLHRLAATLRECGLARALRRSRSQAGR